MFGPGSYVLTAIFAPIIGAVVVFIVGALSGKEKLVAWLSVAIAAVSLLACLRLIPYVIHGGKVTLEYPLSPVIGFSFTVLVDPLSVVFAVTISLVSFLSLVYAVGYMEHADMVYAFYAHTLLFIAGMVGTVFASNLLLFYVFWELMCIPPVFMIFYWGETLEARRIALKFFVFTHVGALSILLGILGLYTMYGTFELLEMAKNTSILLANKTLAYVTFALLFVGFGVKMATFPLHNWLPDAHAEAPTPISCMLSGVMIKCGAYALARFAITLFKGVYPAFSTAFTIIAVITMVYGGLMAMAQTDIKRLLAFSSISQIGYIFFGLAIGTWLAVVAAVFHVINHALFKAMLFMCAGAVRHQTGTRDLTVLRGLAKRMPITALVFTIGGLAIAGTPPFNGFVSEFLLFTSGIKAGVYIPTLIAILTTIITAAYYLWVLLRAFFKETPANLAKVKEVTPVMYVPMFILAVLCVIIGVYPAPVVNLLAKVPGIV